MKDNPVEQEIYSKLYNYAIRLLARRDYSEYKLRSKLRAQCEDETLVDRVVLRVQESGYQSDERYVKSFIAYAVSQNKGPIWIQSKLREKGLNKVLVERELSETDVDWQELADEQLSRKYKAPCIDQKEKSRRFRFLISRGFEMSVVIRSLERQEALLPSC